MQALTVNLVEGDTAPQYDTGIQLQISHVTVTEKGTQKGLPMVDFVMNDPLTGEQRVLVLTGRQVITLAAAIRGVNLRNHGVEDP